MLLQTIASTIDQLALYTMQRRVPVSLHQSADESPALSEVLDATAVDTHLTPPYSILAPGRRPVWVRSVGESLPCQVRVQLSDNPDAPLIIFHHGFSEFPYDNSFRRIFRRPLPQDAHVVCIRAPFHTTWGEPLREVFKSFQRIYQTFSGSLRLIELVQREFEAQGTPFTIVTGTSWGGITSLLYANLFGGVRAAVPLLSSPNLAQVILDGADRANMPLPISREAILERLDFTSSCRVYDPARVFPLMGQGDQFFKLESHAGAYATEPVVVDRAHVFTTDGEASLRRHVFETLDWASQHPFADA